MNEWKKTTCIFCIMNCGLEVQTEGNRITKVRPDKDSPRTRGYVCRKGLSIAHFQDHADRLTHPLKRVGSSFEKISWEQATTEIAGRLKEVVDTHGPKSLALMGEVDMACHFGSPFGLALLRGLGSRYHYHALAQERTGPFFLQGEAYGVQGLDPIPDHEHTDVLLIWGKNPWRSHHMNRARPLLMEIKEDPDKLLIVIDPCKSDTAKRADIHLAPRPGTNALLMKSIIALLLEEGIYDKEYVRERTNGFDKIFPYFENFDIAEALKVCRLDEEEIRRLTRLLAERKSCIHTDLGVLMDRNSTATSYLQMILINLLGRIGQQGGNVFYGGIAEPGNQTPIDDPSNWRTVETDFPAIMGWHPPNVMPEEIMNDKPDRLRAVLVSKANPLRSYADTKAYEEAFKELDLLVTVEIAMTETARLSHYILPAKSPYEKWDGAFFSLNTYPESYFHLRRPVCDPVGEPKEEAEIWTDLADELGLIPEYPSELASLALKDRPEYAKALMDYMSKNPGNMELLPFIVGKTLGRALNSPALSIFWSVLAQYSQAGGAKLERAGFTPSPMLGEELFQKFIDTPGDILVCVQDVKNNIADSIKTPDGKVNLHIPIMDDWVAKITPEDELEALESTGYPMVLAAGERTDFNSNSRMRNRDWIGDKRVCAMRIHPDDAKELGLETGGKALVETEAGSLEIEVEVSDRPCRGMVVIPHGFGLEHCGQVEGVNLNHITSARNRDPFTATPLHKFVPCKVSAK